MKFLELVPMSQGGRIMPKKISRSGWAFALLAALVPGISAAQPAGSPALSLHDGVVVDLASGAAYVMSREGGIDAIQLSTGNVIWKSREAAKPLLAREGLLLAQARPGEKGGLALVTLDTRQGTAKARVDVPLAWGLRANVVDGPSQSFRAEAFVTADKSTVVTWTAEDGKAFEAMPPSTEESLTPSASASLSVVRPRRGAVRVDPAGGNAVAMEYEQAQSLRASALASRAEGIRVRSVGTAMREMTSLDGKHVLQSERSPQSTLQMPYRWTVKDAAGRVIGTVDAPVSLAPFVVSGSQVLYVAQPSAYREGEKIVEQPLRLVALDAATGSKAWTSPLLDPAYRGPFPP